MYRYYDYVTPVWQPHFTPAWHYDSGTSDTYTFYDEYNDYDNNFYKEQSTYVYENYGWDWWGN